jgi:hypothetical protein
MQCPDCSNALDPYAVDCSVCGWELPPSQQRDWQPVARIRHQAFAELARETLQQMNIPVAIIGKSGFFGSAGLVLAPWFSDNHGCFELLVPVAYAGEALNVLEMTLGDKFQKVESAL